MVQKSSLQWASSLCMSGAVAGRFGVGGAIAWSQKILAVAGFGIEGLGQVSYSVSECSRTGITVF